MKKKLLSIAMALVLCMGLVSCGGGGDASGEEPSASQDEADLAKSDQEETDGGQEETGDDLEELLAQAEEIEVGGLRDLAEEYFNDSQAVTDRLGGKVIKITGQLSVDGLFMSGIYTPDDGSVNEAGLSSAEVKIEMNFSEAEQARAEEAIFNLLRVTIVGRIDEGMTEEDRNTNGMKDGQDFVYEGKTYCYTMSDAHFVTDTFEYTGTLEKFDDGEYGITYSDGSGGNYVQFREGEEIPPEGTEVTIQSKFVSGGGAGHVDAVIVK